MKKIWLLLAATGLMMACRGGGDEPAVKSATAKVTSEGGEYNLDNGVTLIVPSGAVSGTTEVKVEYLENPDESTGTLPNDIQGMVRFEPEGLVFDHPIQVKIPLNQTVTDKTDIVYWSADDERWYITDRGTVSGGEVTFYVEHFSSYASIGGGWSDILRMMDTYVSGSDNEEAISNAVKRFLEQELWEEMGLKDLHFAAHTSAGNSCAKACGLYGFWSSEQGGTTRQGGGTIHEKSKHNLVSVIAMSNSRMTGHLQGETQVAADRIIEIYGEPCATELVGEASPASIEKGKKTTVTVKAHCDGSPLADQLIQISCSPELSCSTVNKKTDSNGEIEISVKGEEEGTGYVYAKAVNTINPEIETEIQIPVKVGEGENWRITIDMNVHCSASFGEEYENSIYDTNYQFEGGDQSIEYSYTLVADVTIQESGEVVGTISAINHPEAFQLNMPTFSQSGIWQEVYFSYSASSNQTTTASPIFKEIKNVPVDGFSGNYNGKNILGFSTIKDGSDYTIMFQDMLNYTFMSPNLTCIWNSQEDERTDNGSRAYTIAGPESNDNYMGCTLGNFVFELMDLQEISKPFQTSMDDDMYEIQIDETCKLTTGSDIYVGIFTEIPGRWRGARHYTVTGTLKVEQLDKK